MSNYKLKYDKIGFLIYNHIIKSKGKCIIIDCAYCAKDRERIKKEIRRKKVIFHLTHNPLRFFFTSIEIIFETIANGIFKFIKNRKTNTVKS